MSEMITRASDAIAKIRNAGDFGYRATDCELARAAIHTMREPMMRAAYEAYGCCSDEREVSAYIGRVIDAALQDKSQ